MIPYHTVFDPAKRRTAFAADKIGKQSNPIAPLYTGFEKSLVKESVFTASYIMGGAYFGNVFKKFRPCVHAQIQRAFPSTQKDEAKAKKYTDIAMASMKASAAGAFASCLTGPIDMAGKNIPVQKQIVTTGRKAMRKGAYNAINTVVVQYLYSSKIHRRLLNTLVAAPEQTSA